MFAKQGGGGGVVGDIGKQTRLINWGVVLLDGVVAAGRMKVNLWLGVQGGLRGKEQMVYNCTNKRPGEGGIFDF